MKFGYLTTFSKEEAQLAASIGFDSLEVHARSWPLDEITGKSKMKEIVARTAAVLSEFNLSFSAVAGYDSEVLARPVKSAVRSFRKIIELAAALGAPVVATLAGRLADAPLADTIARFKQVWGEIARVAADRGVRIAFENWPGFHGFPIRSRNIAYCPAYWDMMFSAVENKALGIEFDPSHLYWLGIDHIAAARRYAARIYHVHAKDTEILDEARQSFGIIEGRWYRYRIPGFGEIDWPDFISTLFEGGYNGGIAIEHEDKVFSGGNRAEGLRLGYNYLAPLLPK